MRRIESSRRRFQLTQDAVKRRIKEKQVLDMDGRERPLERNRAFVELLRSFWGVLGQQRGKMVLALVFLTISTGLALLPLYAPKLVVDHVLSDEPAPGWLQSVMGEDLNKKAALLAILIGTIVLTTMSQGVGLAGRWVSTRLSKRVVIDVRRRVFDHAARLPMHRVQAIKSGGLTSILRDDAGAPGLLVFEMVYNPWRAVVQLVGSLAVLAFVDWRLLLLSAGMLPVVWLTHRTWISQIRPMWRQTRALRKGVDAHSTEVFGGIRVVRGFGRQRAEGTRFLRGNAHMARHELKAWWWMRGVDTAWALLIPAATAVLLFYGGLRILDDRQAVAAGTLAATSALTVGGLVAFLSYLAAMLGPVATLAATATGLQNSLAGFDRVLDLLEEDQEMPAPDDALVLDRDLVQGEIKMAGLSFAYPGTTKPALSDIDIDVPAGTVVALVGPSGAGKTTLCNLVARFYDPTEGAVLLDGVDLKRYPVEHYRHLLGVVEQDIFLFDAAIRDNIAYGNRAATEEQMIDAARRANAHEFIAELPKGYDTMVGERGVRLSGGQRQRLAIARALLADPKILVLDEATSNLDTHSEKLIQASLTELMQDRTCFVIAHRLSTIRHADLILVIDHGRVIEQGTHEQLMTAGGVYQGMVVMQTGEALSEPVQAVEY